MLKFLRSLFANPMRTTKIFYKTRDGQANYRFSFEEQPGGSWRAYILDQPSYRGRDEGAHTTHRLSDGTRKYVCWNSTLPTLDAAKTVAALWADKTQDYIRTGQTF